MIHDVLLSGALLQMGCSGSVAVAPSPPSGRSAAGLRSEPYTAAAAAADAAAVAAFRPIALVPAAVARFRAADAVGRSADSGRFADPVDCLADNAGGEGSEDEVDEEVAETRFDAQLFMRVLFPVVRGRPALQVFVPVSDVGGRLNVRVTPSAVGRICSREDSAKRPTTRFTTRQLTTYFCNLGNRTAHANLVPTHPLTERLTRTEVGSGGLSLVEVCLRGRWTARRVRRRSGAVCGFAGTARPSTRAACG